MAAGALSIMTITGGTSTSVTGAPNFWKSNRSVSPFNVSVEVTVNSTATTPNWSILVTNDTPTTSITATSSSASVLKTTDATAVWFSSLSATNSSNAFVSITAPFEYLTLAATAGTSVQTITATILQCG